MVRDLSIGSINLNSGFGASAAATFENLDVTAEGVNINSGFNGATTTATLRNVTVDSLDTGVNVNAFESTTVATLRNVVASSGNDEGLVANDVGTSVDVVGSTFTGGEAGVEVSGASVTFTNSTISGSGEVGLEVSGGSATLRHVTIAGNAGGGIESDGSVTLANSVLANPPLEEEPGQCAGSITSNGGNVASDASCSLDGPGDQPGVDPLLGALGDNGGPTPTQMLLSGSPAIDAALDAACPGSDQRGVARPQDGDGDGTAACDAGAVEVEAAAPPTTAPPTTPPPTTAPPTTPPPTTAPPTPTTAAPTTAPPTSLAPAAAELPRTGGGAGPLAAVAVGLALAGIGLLVGNGRARGAVRT